MLRIRFHGRGGQGMKTASRILGSAAFAAGFVVQDAPIYGAERRGAPMAAFTRLNRGSILERGAIAQPDLLVVADDTLLAEPSAQPLAGCDRHCTVLLNSGQRPETFAPLTAYEGRLILLDFTRLVLAHTQTLAGLSTALGIAAARLTGLSLPEALLGLEAELHGAHLLSAQYAANVQLAEEVYTLMHPWPPVQESDDLEPAASVPLVTPVFAPPAQAAPSIYALANSPARHTGSWRQFRPVLEQDKCSRCWVCFVRCPEAAITLDVAQYPVIDYTVCKGCLLCAHECPTHALRVDREVR
ncbi:MAG: 2-oxoacid:acceptor oxidoreductase family protein [Candidatus Tectimicrobiota bacterium]